MIKTTRPQIQTPARPSAPRLLAIAALALLPGLAACDEPLQPGAREQSPRQAQPTGDAPVPTAPPAAGLPDPVPAFVLSEPAKAAIARAESKDAKEHERLAAELIDAAWLDRLDPPALARVAPASHLQLTHVLRALARSAPTVFSRLAAEPAYVQSETRRAALLTASGACREPGEALVVLWHAQIEPEGDELETTIAALFESGSAAGHGVLETAFANEEFDPELVASWFHGPLLAVRQNEATVAWIEKLLAGGGLREGLSARLVDALFEYRPRDWYPQSQPAPIPPSRAKLTDASRTILLRIAERARVDGELTAERVEAIRAELRAP